jgi:hypothetical protein
LDGHTIVVMFRDLAVPPFGEPWVDRFRADELVLVRLM